ncbi:MAG TPA: hypothetical protein VFW73_03370 [Lacipirellulaceae bacterium]|nr:hypothetical protein [Lacipirellulaceae bacterium]
MFLLTGGCMQTAPVATVQTYYPVDSFQEYTQRADRVTLSAGNAQEVNTRIQEIDPWPRYVANKRIPGNGERMAGAVERYRDVSKQRQAPRPLSIQQTSSGGGAAAGGAGQ